jgi:hypothetical protein
MGSRSAGHSGRVLAASQVVNARAEQLAFSEFPTAQEHLASIHRLCVAKEQVDLRLRQTLGMRVAIASLPEDPMRRARVRVFLKFTSKLTDLSGRLNYLLRATIIRAAFALANRPPVRDRLVEQLAADRSTIGASLMAPLLLDPPEDSPNGARPASSATKVKILRYLARHGRSEAAPIVVRYLNSREATPELVITATDALCRLGLAQAAPADSLRSPLQGITAAALRERLQGIDPAQLQRASRRRRTVLLQWLAGRAEWGVGATGYAVNGFVIRPGDWVLMRNASPYNLFTDLSPGLFTHAGVAALERDRQGADRLVLVDLNERDTRVGATNIEEVLPSSLYFAVLRHDDPAVARKMAARAASIVGNPARFDLTFETSRLEPLRGQALQGRKIETYCAGLLLLCAQASDLPRDEFFPVVEYPAGAAMAGNLRHIGLQIGADFVSPTGALFAPRMKVVYFSEPMYDPERHIEQEIYDFFARRMASETLEPRQNLFQSLRQQLANASQSNPVLGNALAAAAGVDAHTDLAAGARALAVVEILDRIALGNSGEFAEATAALEGGPIGEPARRRLSPRQIEKIESLRRRHADLAARLEQGPSSRWQVSVQLVDYYADRGKRQIDEYFFSAPSDTDSAEAGQ